jgi:hypothetical protein
MWNTCSFGIKNRKNWSKKKNHIKYILFGFWTQISRNAVQVNQTIFRKKSSNSNIKIYVPTDMIDVNVIYPVKFYSSFMWNMNFTSSL